MSVNLLSKSSMVIPLYSENSIDSMSMPDSLIFLFEFSRLISYVLSSIRIFVIFSDIALESKSDIDLLFLSNKLAI